MVCVGLSERDLLQWHDVTRKILGEPLGGADKFWGCSGPPWHPLAPPLLAPKSYIGPRAQVLHWAPHLLGPALTVHLVSAQKQIN